MQEAQKLSTDLNFDSFPSDFWQKLGNYKLKKISKNQTYCVLKLEYITHGLTAFWKVASSLANITITWRKKCWGPLKLQWAPEFPEKMGPLSQAWIFCERKCLLMKFRIKIPFWRFLLIGGLKKYIRNSLGFLSADRWIPDEFPFS